MFASSGISENPSILVAVRNAFRNASDQFRGNISCIFLFISGDKLESHSQSIRDALEELAPNIPLFGCSAESVVGTGREVEGQCAATVLIIGGLSSPPIMFSMECLNTPDGPTVLGYEDAVLQSAHACNGLMVVACPMSFSIDLLIEAIEPARGQPVVPILGGYCSSQNWDQPNVLFGGNEVFHRGAVGLVLPPELKWNTIVSQGCRPIGEPMIVTALEGDMILGLGGRPALTMLRDMFQKLPNHERAMAIESLLIGRAITEYSDTFSHGDFLIRNVQGVDADSGGIHVTERFQVGQTVRFHVRDAEGADSDLMQLLQRVSKSSVHPKACMLFSCNGRGQRMFAQPNHDALAIDKYFPGLPLTGFFAAGEFAPLTNRNLTHGFTAVAAFLSESSPSQA